MRVVWYSAALSLMSMGIGVLRDVLIVQRLGFSFFADMIVIVLLVPTVLENILGFVIRDSTAVAFSALSGRPPNEVGRFARLTLGLVLAVAAFVSGCYLLSSGWLLGLLAPGWGSAELQAAEQASILASSIVFFQTVAYFFVGYESVNGRFIVSASRPLLLGIAGVLALFFAHGAEAPSAFIASQGVVLGIFSVFLFVIFWRSNRLRNAPYAQTVGDGDVVSFSFGLVPVAALVVALQQVPFLIERAVATTVASGVPTLLSFVYRLVTIPQSIFAASVLAVMLPALLRERRAGLERLGFASQRLSATIILGVVSASLFYAFDNDFPMLLGMLNVSLGAMGASFKNVLHAYSSGIPAFFVSLYLIKVSIAYERPSMLVLPGIVSVLIQLLAVKPLSAWLGPAGVALSTSLFFISFSIGSYAALARVLPIRVDVSTAFKILAASLLAFLVTSAAPEVSSPIGVVLKAVAYFAVLMVSLFLVGCRHVMGVSYWKALL